MTTELTSAGPVPTSIIRPQAGPVIAARSITITVLSGCELVRAGVARILERPPASFQVHVPGANDGKVGTVDVLLVDPDSDDAEPPSVSDLSLAYGARHVVVHSWDSTPQAVQASICRGASGHLDKRLDAATLADALRRVANGEQVVAVCDQDQVENPDVAALAELHHLSVREAEILRLITQGLSNKEIAQTAYLSINTVKSYIRTAYRKMGVKSRSQAILWGIDRGFGDAPQASATPDARRLSAHRDRRPGRGDELPGHRVTGELTCNQQTARGLGIGQEQELVVVDAIVQPGAYRVEVAPGATRDVAPAKDSRAPLEVRNGAGVDLGPVSACAGTA
jgi:two-component system, NarL family, response regulator LiaR